MPHIVSTLSNDQVYTQYAPGAPAAAAPNVMVNGIHIKGKANIQRGLTTSRGAITSVTDEQLALLEKDEVFQTHQKNGHVEIVRRAADPEKVAKDMTTRDESAPLNQEHGDFDLGGRAAGVAPSNAKIE